MVKKLAGDSAADDLTAPRRAHSYSSVRSVWLIVTFVACQPMDEVDAEAVAVGANGMWSRSLRMTLGASTCSWQGPQTQFFDLCRLKQPPRETQIRLRAELVTDDGRAFDVDREVWLPAGGSLRTLNVFPPFAGEPTIQLDLWFEELPGVTLERKGFLAYELQNHGNETLTTHAWLSSDQDVHRKSDTDDAITSVDAPDDCSERHEGLPPGASLQIGCLESTKVGELNFGVLIQTHEELAPSVTLERVYGLHDFLYAE